MSDDRWRLFALVRSALFATVTMFLMLIFLPWELGVLTHDWNFSGASVWRLLGLIPFVGGLLLGLWCMWAFAWRGLGTPAPFDPPKKLVVSGVYRYVRNPMYVGAFTAFAGEWIVIGRRSWAALLYPLFFLIASNIFIRKVEEPSLRKKFGEEFEEYCKNVPRWRPRRTPWKRSVAVRVGSLP